MGSDAPTILPEQGWSKGSHHPFFAAHVYFCHHQGAQAHGVQLVFVLVLKKTDFGKVGRQALARLAVQQTFLSEIT